MAKKFIFSTDIITPKLRFLAEEYHRHHGDSHVQVVTLYRVSDSPDGSWGVEWLLTRYNDKQGKAWSSMLIVEYDGNGQEYLHEFVSAIRKGNGEKAMIEAWKAFVEEEE